MNSSLKTNCPLERVAEDCESRLARGEDFPLHNVGIWYYNNDANGNLIAKGTNAMAATSGGKFEGWKYDAKKGEVWRYSYDLSNRLVKAEYSAAGTGGLKEKAAYKYDWRNLMVSRTLGGVTEYFEYDDDGRLIYTEKGNTKTDFIWYGNILWAERRTDASGEKVYYHHTDHLGTTECITDINKKVVWTAEYESFGKVISESGSADFVPSFTGKQLDEATGLYYFNARWYDCEIGRFMTQDPARDGGNWWAYCTNNPLTYIDPTGLTTQHKDKKGKERIKAEIKDIVENSFKVGLFGEAGITIFEVLNVGAGVDLGSVETSASLNNDVKTEESAGVSLSFGILDTFGVTVDIKKSRELSESETLGSFPNTIKDIYQNGDFNPDIDAKLGPLSTSASDQDKKLGFNIGLGIGFGIQINLSEIVDFGKYLIEGDKNE